ncbi:MAG: DUF4175 domain-containing protein [Flavobacteriales bacterium]|nr:DUF4175 domain-containing protein [Flavobacteriales bacterium]|tara:strand:- start:14048 stop:17422 length:3375 start_codon:yes stop_codon:yes gene_type:complete
MKKENYHLLIQKLDEFIRKYYFNKLIRGAIYFGSLALATFILLVLLEHFGKFNTTTRTVLFYGSLSVLSIALLLWVIYPISQILSIGKRISHEQASQIIGKHFSEIDDKLYNVLQLKKLSEQSSSDLIESGINQKINQLKPVPFQLAVNLGENKKYLKYLIPPAAVIALLLAISPQIVSDSTNRLVAHNIEFIPLAPYQIILENQKLSTFKNEDFKLKVRIEGEEIPNQMKVHFEGQEFLMSKNAKNQFSFSFNNLDDNITFYLSDGIYNSKNYEVDVVPKAGIKNFIISLDYPNYLGKKDETISDKGDLTIPEGTEVKWNFIAENTDGIYFYLSDSSYQVDRIAENEYQFSKRLFNNSYYSVNAYNQFINSDTANYKVEVIQDLRPSIEVESRTDSNSSKIIYFKGLVKDDYGFSRLEFRSRFLGANDSVGMENIVQLPINKNLPQSDFYHSLNLNQFELKSGDQVEYYFQVWDNDGVNGSKSARTQTLIFKAPSKDELAEKEDSSNNKIKDDLKENIELSQEIKRDLEELKQSMLNKKQLGYQEKKKLEDLMKKHKQLQKNMQQLKEENRQKNQLQKEYQQMDENLLEKQKQLEKLMENVMTEEMKEMMKEVEKMMEKLQKDQLQKQLEKIELSNEDMEKELDRNLELFKQLEFEKQLDDVKKKVDELKEKQQKLKEETLAAKKKEEKEKLKEKQEELNKEMDELSEKMDELEKKNQELEEPNEMPDTESLEDQIKKDMKESAEELSKMNEQKAGEKQQDSEDGMQELSEQMEAMQMQMQSAQQAENLEDLRQLLENLIDLSFSQEELMENLKSTNINDPKYVELAQEQNKLQDDSKVIEDSLFALSKRVIQLEGIVNREMSSIKTNMQKAVEQLAERNTAMANNRQQYAMTSLNNLALLLDEAMQQMQQQMQAMMQSKGQCKKPGSKPGGKPSNKMGNMKSLQQQLNKQMEQLKKAMEQGQKPGGKKGEKPGEGMPGGQGGMSKQLAQMAAKQAAIRKAIQQMQEELEKGNGGGGSLEKLQEMMEQTETDLVNKQITNETILRQQEILTRLLQSEKAEREREKDEKREAIEFTDEFSRNPKSFFEYNSRKESEIELLKTLPPSFNNFYKSKVTEYFNQINP